MCRLSHGFLASVGILGLWWLTPPLPAQQVDAQQVQKSIDAAVRYFKTNQLPDGGWPPYREYQGGVTGLITLALLNAGLPPQDVNVARALDYLRSLELDQTYTVSLQTMAFCVANPNKYAQIIKRNTDWLIEQQLPNGGWGYGQDRGGTGDPSNAQFALLALHEAQRAGVSLPASDWRKVFGKARAYWVNAQNADGSFSYSGSEPPRGSMTCAGIASLVIVGAALDSLESSTDQIQCCGNENQNQDRIEKGLAWLASKFTVMENPVYGQHHLYYMYALERVGRLTGRRYIDRHDWYREGAAHLLTLQDPLNGYFRPRRGAALGTDFTETAFALLFLAKGKRQTIINRLKYGGLQDDWNHHPLGMQHLTAHTEQAWKRDLSWQNIDIARTTNVRDLLETPVLFISGTSSPRFTQNQKLLLKEYVDQGGFIFAEGCQGNGCDGREFEAYFQKLVVELFDQPLEKLPPDHPLWYAESRVVPKDLPADAWLYGVQTCCRLGVVYVPYSLSCRWQLNVPYGIKPDFPEDVQADLDTATKIGINVLAYATGKELKEKLDTVTILEDVRNLAPTDRNVFILPKLRHNAGADDAPRSIPRNLMQWLDKTNPFMLSDEKRLINIAEDELQQYPVVFMHGRGTLQLSGLQRQALRTYLNNGGFLFADAICGDQAFAESFRREMQLVLDEPLSKISETHPMFSDKFYGFDIRQVRMIDPDLAGDSIIAAQRSIAPRLEGAKSRID